MGFMYGKMKDIITAVNRSCSEQAGQLMWHFISATITELQNTRKTARTSFLFSRETNSIHCSTFKFKGEGNFGTTFHLSGPSSCFTKQNPITAEY